LPLLGKPNESRQSMTVHSRELNSECLIEVSEQSWPARDDRTAALPEVSAETVRAVIRARRLRAKYFNEELFADPAWDMMLELFQGELMHRRVVVSSLCAGAAVPPTTALRWLKTIVRQGLFVRRNDPLDGRRVYVELSAETSAALRRYFGQIQGTACV
jgi:DNA-binding MarR family transcriptional regulator